MKIYTKILVGSSLFFKKKYTVLFSLCALTIVINTAFASPVTQTDFISYRPQIHSAGDDFFVVWTEVLENNSEVYFSKSTDNGLTFSKPLNLSSNHGHSAFPRMTINENNVWVTWYDYSPGQSDIFFAKSSDFGETFSTVNITNNTSASYNPWIASDSDFVYLVWNDGGKSQEVEIDGKPRIIDILLGDAEIMFGYSSDKGQTFEIKNVSQMPGDSFNPRMKIDGENIYLVWTDHVENSEIFFSKANNSNFLFSEPINVSKSKTSSFDSGIDVYGENVFLIWKEQNDNGTEIYFSKSSNGGNSFNNPISITGKLGDYKITRDTQISVSYPHLYVTFYDEKNSDVFLAHSPDMGETFYDSINLSQSPGDSILSQLVTDENRVFVIWNDNSDGDNDVFLRESDNYGYVFGPKINLSNDDNNSEIFILGPQIVKSDNFINIVFENKTDSTSNLVLKQKHLDSSLAISFSNTIVELSLEDYKIQPEKETLIEVKTLNSEKEKNLFNYHSLIIFDSENKTIFQSKPTLPVNGSSFYNVIFPKPGQYSLKLNFEDYVTDANNEMLVTVIPEFEFGVLLILSLTISIVVVSKRVQPRIFG